MSQLKVKLLWNIKNLIKETEFGKVWNLEI